MANESRDRRPSNKRPTTTDGTPERRIQDLESTIDDLKRKVAALEVEVEGGKRRVNATVDLFEQRVDQIYRQVTNELSRALGQGVIRSESEIDVDRRLASLFARATHVDPDTAVEMLAGAISGELKVGEIAKPLTLSGFRLDRKRCREDGDHIVIYPKSVSGAGIAVFGPYKRLKPGTYSLEATIRPERSVSALLHGGEVALDVYSSLLDKVVGAVSQSLRNVVRSGRITTTFDWPAEAAAGPTEFRLHQRSNEALQLVGFSLTVRD